MRRKISIVLVALLILFTAAAAWYYSKNEEVVNTILIRFSPDFIELRENIYISKDTPEEMQDSVLKIISASDERVCRYWDIKRRSGNPDIIFCYSVSKMLEYSRNKSMLTYKIPLGCSIVFSKEHLDKDMLSHELFHTELAARVGYSKNVSEIPTWFDEGMALQVDHRYDFSEEKYLDIKDSIRTTALENISTPAGFWSGNYYHHYLIARHEVNSWLKSAGKKAFFRLIDKINSGEKFSDVYSLLKHKAASEELK